MLESNPCDTCKLCTNVLRVDIDDHDYEEYENRCMIPLRTCMANNRNDDCGDRYDECSLGALFQGKRQSFHATSNSMKPVTSSDDAFVKAVMCFMTERGYRYKTAETIVAETKALVPDDYPEKDAIYKALDDYLEKEESRRALEELNQSSYNVNNTLGDALYEAFKKKQGK